MDPSTEPALPSRKRPARGKIGKKKIVLYGSLCVFVVLAAIVGYYVYSFYAFADRIYVPPEKSQPVATGPAPTDGSLPSPIPVAEAPDWSGRERVNILLMGGDSRGVKSTVKPRSDTMIVISVDPVEKRTNLFSLLRDSYVEIPGRGSNRLNAAITMGGPLLAMDTVHRFIDLPIHYYVYTDFEGFISLIDELGGIEFEVDKNMRRTDNRDDPRYNINLEQGLQQLDGLTALQYVRYRGDAMSDFARAERQRKFLTAVADKLQSTTSLLKIPQLLGGIAPYIETNIPPGDLLKLARLGLKLDTGNLSGIQIPQMNAFRNEIISGMDVLVPDLGKVRTYVKEQLEGATPPPVPQNA